MNALEIIAEQTLDNKNFNRRQNEQRRNQVVDIYGETHTRNLMHDGGAGYSYTSFFYSISGDMVYLERYGFKLTLEGETGSNYKITLNSVDITPYLAMQYGGVLYFETGTYPSNVIETDFDILLVICDMKAVNDENWKTLSQPGFKQLVVTRTDGVKDDVAVSIHKYIKYSHLNR